MKIIEKFNFSVPKRVVRFLSKSFEKPKSAIFKENVDVSRRFSGLRSRWQIPFE